LHYYYYFKARKAAEMAELQREAENEANNQVNMKEVERENITEIVTTMGLSIKEVTFYQKICLISNE